MCGAGSRRPAGPGQAGSLIDHQASELGLRSPHEGDGGPGTISQASASFLFCAPTQLWPFFSWTFELVTDFLEVVVTDLLVEWLNLVLERVGGTAGGAEDKSFGRVWVEPNDLFKL